MYLIKIKKWVLVGNVNIVWCKVLGWLGWRTFHYSGSRNEDDKLPAKFQDGAAAICAVW